MQKETAIGGLFRLSQKLRRIFRVSEKQDLKHFPSGRVPDGKYISGCKCGICTPKAYKLCAQQTAKTGEKPRKGLFAKHKRPPLAVSLLVSMDYLTWGRDAAATAWPTRRIFSSGRVTQHLAASSGYSAARMSLVTRRMVSPPLPDMTRPISMM